MLLKQMAREQHLLRQEGWVDSVQSSEFGLLQQAFTNVIGGLERIRHQPLPASSTFFIRGMTWVYGYLVFLKLDAWRVLPTTSLEQRTKSVSAGRSFSAGLS